ncbi:MAG: hypothetical protein ABI769_01545 [Pseudomonadota bacterium]
MAWILLALALVGAGAALLGPPEKWWGIDLGSAGAAVFGFTLWVGALLFARYPDRIFSPDWSIAERRAWCSLVFVTLIFVNFTRFLSALGQRESAPASLGEIPSSHLTLNFFVLLIAWAVVSQTLRGKEKDVVEIDERDLRLRRAADRAGDWALSFVVIACVVLLVALPAKALAWWLAPLIAANVLIGLLIFKSLVEQLYLVVRYAWERR